MVFLSIDYNVFNESFPNLTSQFYNYSVLPTTKNQRLCHSVKMLYHGLLLYFVVLEVCFLMLFHSFPKQYYNN